MTSDHKLFKKIQTMPSDKAIQSGYLVKLGAKVKNWKLRWMVLQGTGMNLRLKTYLCEAEVYSQLF